MSKALGERSQKSRGIKQSATTPISELDESEIDIANTSKITNLSINVSESYENDLEEYKSEINRILQEKKKKGETVFTFNKVDAEEKLRKKYEQQLEEALRAEREKQMSNYEKKKQELEDTYAKKGVTEKEKIRKEIEKQYESKTDSTKVENQRKISNLKQEIQDYQRELNTGINDTSKSSTFSVETEIKNYELQKEREGLEYQNDGNGKLAQKKNELNEEYERKKLEYENTGMESQTKEKQRELNDNMNSQDAILQSKKAMLVKANEAKGEHYKTSGIAEYYKSQENEKKEIMASFQNELQVVKDDYEQMKLFYEQQKLICQTEQSIIAASTFISKMKNISDNKSTVFKNGLEQNYFIGKKKGKEGDSIQELSSFSNKDIILGKISELLNLIFYANVYETLYTDMNNEKEMLGKYLDDLLQKCDGIIQTFNSDKKFKLGMYLCNPNFN